jgi:hypothetical protein
MAYEVVMLRPAQGSREATPRSDKEALSNIADHDTQGAAKAAKEAQVAPLREHDFDHDHD